MITHILTPYITNQHAQYSDRVIVMGDMNTLSPWDRRVHREENIANSFRRTDHSVFNRMRKKYLTSDGRDVNYRPMEILLE